MSDPKRPAWPLVAIALAVVFATAARFAPLGYPFMNDSGVYVGLGKIWVDGGTPYVDLWDTKLPGVLLLGGIPYALFGSTWPAYLGLGLLLGLAAATMLTLAVRRLDPDATPASYWLTLAVAIVLVHHPQFLGDGFQLETPQVLFASLSVWLAATYLADRKRSPLALPLLAGLAAGLAALAKPTGLAVAGGFGFVLVVRAIAERSGRDIVAAAMLTVGAVVVALAIAVWTIASGMAEQMPHTLREIRLYGSGTPWSQVLRAKVPILIGLALLPALAAGAGSLRRRGGSRGFGHEQPDHPRLPPRRRDVVWPWLFALGWLALEIVGALLQKRAYSYQFLPIVAPAAILCGLLLASRPTSPWPGRLAIAACGVLVLLAVKPIVVGYGHFARGSHRLDAIGYLRDRTEPGDAIFADNVGRWTVLLDREPGARLCMMIHLTNHDDAPRLFVDELLADLAERRPAYVLLPLAERQELEIARWEDDPILLDNPDRRAAYRAAWNRVFAWLDEHYVEEIRLDGLRLLRPRDGSPVESPA